MPQNFSGSWASLRENLPKNHEIRDWGAKRGYTGMIFRVLYHDPGSVTVASKTTMRGLSIAMAGLIVRYLRR